MKPIVIGDSKKLLAEAAARERSQRRERIATAAMTGLLASHGKHILAAAMADDAVTCADALIRELDREKEA